MFEWTEKRIEWYERALSYTGYASALADELCPYLPANETVCDLGCGTGYLARELARRGYASTGADKSVLALNTAREQKKLLGLEKLTITECDWNSLGSESVWDNVIMVSAGHFDSELTAYLSHCRRRLILVVKEDKSSHVLPKGQTSELRKRSYLVADVLGGLNYEVKSFSPEFGQPLKSLEEAKEYIEYFGGETQSSESAVNRLTATGRSDFPFYLPNRSDKLIYIIHK